MNPPRRTVGGALAIALALSLTAAAPVAFAAKPKPKPSPGKPPVVAATDPTGSIAAARVAARTTGQRVEAVSERSEVSTTWVNPDGTLTTELSAGPVRFLRDGAWTDVDLTLRAAPDGSVAPAGHPHAMKLAGPGGKRPRSLAEAQAAQAPAGGAVPAGYDYNGTADWARRNVGTRWEYGQDCTNFASKALYYGGGMHTRAGWRSWDSAWWKQDYWFFGSHVNRSYTWAGAANLHRHLLNHRSSTWLTSTYHARPGDIVFFKWRNERNINHAAVVVSWGSRMELRQHGRQGVTTLNDVLSDAELQFRSDYSSHPHLEVTGYPVPGTLDVVQQVVWRIADGSGDRLAKLGTSDGGDAGSISAAWVREFRKGAQGAVTADFQDDPTDRQTVVVTFHDTGQTKELTLRPGGRNGEDGWRVALR
ncbi:amidase domain-containing protein [Kitasatospora sp. NPDC048722]|uniref:amidase domain-containing protein n=1 Tax=Kitasatospora sp. NPDC048722 TaxID=3155639 RepID=UPI0033EA60C4